jgi:acetyl-CoA synthetase
MGAINPRVMEFRQEALDAPDRFWASAADGLPWRQRWERVFEWDPDHPDERGRYFKWFGGGITNLAYKCVDIRVDSGQEDRIALICEDERGGRSALTYAQLQQEVKRTAADLRGLGIGSGDRVGIYMPTCAEAIVLMLARTRIGAIHLVVFAGFGSGALGSRLQLAGATALFCSDITYRKGKDVPLKGIVDAAMEQAPDLKIVVVHRRAADDPPMRAGRDKRLLAHASEAA